MLVLILILLFSSTAETLPVSAASNETYFARIMFDQVYLYKTPNNIEDSSNIYFELPKSYFVELTDSANENFYKANYLNLTGYVKKDSVQTITGVPMSPHLENINFRVYAELSRDLRSEPNTSNGTSSQVAYIPLYTRNLTYYGKIVGESLIDGRTNIWYYCKYSADKDYYGYVYSDFCDEMTTILDNTEQVTYVDNPTFEPIKIEENYTIPTNDNNLGVIIGILSVPAIAFLLMIVKGKHILSKEKYKSKEVIDY